MYPESVPRNACLVLLGIPRKRNVRRKEEQAVSRPQNVFSLSSKMIKLLKKTCIVGKKTLGSFDPV